MVVIHLIFLDHYNQWIDQPNQILVFHQYWNKKESMADVASDVKEAVKQVYLADVEAIRNLSNVATQLQSGGLTIPGNLSVRGNLNVDGTNFVLGNKDKDQFIVLISL